MEQLSLTEKGEEQQGWYNAGYQQCEEDNAFKFYSKGTFHLKIPATPTVKRIIEAALKLAIANKESCITTVHLKQALEQDKFCIVNQEVKDENGTI